MAFSSWVQKYTTVQKSWANAGCFQGVRLSCNVKALNHFEAFVEHWLSFFFKFTFSPVNVPDHIFLISQN